MINRGQQENGAARVAPGRHKPEKLAVPFLVFAGLLLGIIIAYVTLLKPVRNPEELKNLVPVHRSIDAFITARKLITPLLSTPPTRWSALHCGEIGHGVWFADGLVGQEPLEGMETPVYWKALFIPTTEQPLFLVLGDRQQGDFQAALRAAGLPPAPPVSTPAKP